MGIHTTSRLALRYPDLAEQADVPAYIQDLASDADTVVAGFKQGTHAARPGASAAYEGWFYWETDTTTLFYCDGAIWNSVGSIAAGSITLAMMGANSVDSSKIVNDSITDADIAPDTITARVIAANAVGASELADNAVDTAAIVDASVTYAKVAGALKPTGTAADADEALRALGTAAHTAAPGNDSRFFTKIVNSLGIYEPGIPNQLRCGRVLTLADFTTGLGLSAPVGLYNLSNVNDSSGNGRNLTNKGVVTFGVGVTGSAGEAAVFTGSTAQALYINDAGAGDPFRTGYGSWGCWFNTAKTGTAQCLLSKFRVAGQRQFRLELETTNTVYCGVSSDGSAETGVSGMGPNVCDNRRHFVSCSYDGTTLLVFVDGVLIGTSTQISGPMFGSNAPFNIGAFGADAGTVGSDPMFGTIDEAFYTPDILSLEQHRYLYAAKVAHGLAAAPSAVRINVKRRKRGGALAVGDFSTQPLHLYNFTAGSANDSGSLNIPYVGSGAVKGSPGANGVSNDAIYLDGASYLLMTDAGLPAARTSRTMGAWIKTNTAGKVIAVYGTAAGNANSFLGLSSTGQMSAGDNIPTLNNIGPILNDGQWHFALFTYDDAAADTLRLKGYVDGKLVGSVTTQITSTILAGAGAFRIGAFLDGTGLWNGQIDAPFILNYAATADEIAKWYAVGSLALAMSPKNEGAHVEGMDATNLYLINDALDSQHQIDVLVAA